ncbi:MAG: choice-of-anchor X domain-containing protein [Candidatus Binataceae bacterium]
MEAKGKVARSSKIAAAIAMLAAIASASPAAIAQTASKPASVTADPMGPTPPRAMPDDPFPSQQNTVLTVTSQVPPDPTLIPGSVILLRVDSNGNQTAVLGQMYDDGTHGDAQAGDGQYTGQFTFNEPSPRLIYLAVQAKHSIRPGCRQSYNNDRQIMAGLPTPAPTEVQAVNDAIAAGGKFLDQE